MEYTLLLLIFLGLLFDRLNVFLFFIISIVLHEIGHIIACIMVGAKPNIKISVFGIKLSGYPNDSVKKSFILLSGPMVNLIFAAIVFFLMNKHFSLNKYMFICVNIILGLFNLLPIYFLDGGQILSIICDNYILRNIMDIMSFVFITIIIGYFSSNYIWSLMCFILFVVYYIINRKNLY